MYNERPSLALRYVSVILLPQQDRPPPTVPLDTSSQLTVLQLYPEYTPPRDFSVELIVSMVAAVEAVLFDCLGFDWNK